MQTESGFENVKAEKTDVFYPFDGETLLRKRKAFEFIHT